jgi:hypothetical protein
VNGRHPLGLDPAAGEPSPIHSLDALARDPVLATELSEPVRLRLLAAAEGVAAVLRLASTAQQPEKRSGSQPGAMLTVPEAAQLAGVTVEQFYRRKRFRPAIVKLGHRTARVDEKKLRRILSETES